MSTPRTLYAIGADLEALEAILVEAGGDITHEEADAAVTAWLEETTGNLKEKLNAYGSLMREKLAMAEQREAEAKRLMSHANTDYNLVSRLKDRLKLFFEEHELTRVETGRFKFTLANNGGKAPLHLHVPPESLPEWAKRIHTTADLEAIRYEIEARAKFGREPLEFAAIGPRGTHLLVR